MLDESTFLKTLSNRGVSVFWDATIGKLKFLGEDLSDDEKHFAVTHKSSIIELLIPKCTWCGGKLSLEENEALRISYCSLGCDDVRREIICDDKMLKSLENKIVNSASVDEQIEMRDAKDELRAKLMLDLDVDDEAAKSIANKQLLPFWLDNYFCRKRSFKR